MKKLFALMLAVILALSLVGCDKEKEVPQSGEQPKEEQPKQEQPKEEKTGIVLSFDQSASLGGFLKGEISLSKVSGEYTLYFGDENGNPLCGYTKIGTVNDSAPYKTEGLVIAPDAKTIVAENGVTSYFEKIPAQYLLNKEDAFVLGALSDVHFGRYLEEVEDEAAKDSSEESLDAPSENQENITVYDPAEPAFDRALDYFEKIGVDMVGIAGDLTSNGESESLEKYNQAIENRPFPVFSVTGNHDYEAYKKGTWQQYITANIEGVEMAPNGLDFIYAPKELGGDVLVFLNITYYSYSYFEKTAPVLNLKEQIPWLESVLESHADDQIYVFFHLFMCGPDGQGHTGVGNIMNLAGCTYTLPFGRGNSDERKMRTWFKKYKNVIYLNGHSHWAFEMVKYNEHANFSDFDGEFCHMVHIPSVTEPRWVEDYDTERTGKIGELSQGWTIYDYGDTVILVPIDFISGTVYTEYMEIIKK